MHSKFKQFWSLTSALTLSWDLESLHVCASFSGQLGIWAELSYSFCCGLIYRIYLFNLWVINCLLNLGLQPHGTRSEALLICFQPNFPFSFTILLGIWFYLVLYTGIYYVPEKLWGFPASADQVKALSIMMNMGVGKKRRGN